MKVLGKEEAVSLIYKGLKARRAAKEKLSEDEFLTYAANRKQKRIRRKGK
ncbi:hypothetical protein [Anaerovirgula multivorans]|nr:hypothetical protein [Anaerovirgula multivorans]